MQYLWIYPDTDIGFTLTLLHNLIVLQVSLVCQVCGAYLFLCDIVLTVKTQPRRITYIERDSFTLSDKEKEVYQAIVKETILQNKRCAQLSLDKLSEMTGIKGRSTVDYQLKKLAKRRLIEIDKTQKTNTVCIVTIYKEYYPI
jgi:predicted transcriptional regulator